MSSFAVLFALVVAAPPGALSAADPLAAARAALRAGRLDEAKSLAADAPGLAGTALERSGDKDGACALYAKDVASPRAPAAALRTMDCLERAHDVVGALRVFRTAVAPSALAADPLVVVKSARLIHALEEQKLDDADQTLVATELTWAWDAVDKIAAPPFDVARREALAEALSLVGRTGATPPDARLLRVVTELPDTAAAQKLVAAGIIKAPPPRDLADALARANRLAERQQNDDVVSLLLPRLDAKDQGATACEARLLLGKTYRKLHKLQSAKKTLDAMSKCPDETKKKAAYLAARVAWIGKNASAATLLAAFAQQYPKDSLTDDVLLWLADVKEKEGDTKAAQKAWSQILADFPDGDMIHEARFRLAWSRAKAGDVDGARALLDEAARNAGGKVDVADRALYWRARFGLAPRVDSLTPTADEKKRDEALAELGALAKSRPASWYGVLARMMSSPSSSSSSSSSSATVLAALGHLRDSADKGTVTPTASLAGDPRFQLAQTLLAGGYDDEALLSLGVLDLAHVAAEDRFVVALLEGRGGDPGAGHALLRDGGLALLPGTPSSDTALAWSLDWPLAHPDSIDAAADENTVPRPLLFGLAREESAFDADVVSWAGAVGLCQLMMPTAADEAKSKSLAAPTVEELKNPTLNARLGASHLSRRLKGLKHPSLAIAAYNAGPGAVAGWNPKGPVDAFVEQIPVDETRNYVKKVTGSWATYAVLDGTVDDVHFALELP